MMTATRPHFGQAQAQPGMFDQLAAARRAIQEGAASVTGSALAGGGEDGFVTTAAKTLGIYYAANTALNNTLGEGGFLRRMMVFIGSYFAAKQVQLGGLINGLLGGNKAAEPAAGLNVTA